MYKIVLALLFSFVAVLVLAQVVFNVNPIAVSKYMIAQVGFTVSVPSNPFNTLAQQLGEKESDLIEKEKRLEQKETVLQEQAERESLDQKKTFLYLLLGGGLLLILIVLNFYFDYRRKTRNDAD